MVNKLLEKYNVPVPRYTSYPTVPFWNMNGVNEENYKLAVKKTFDSTNDSEGISLYIHLPYCESLCTFCGCNRFIPKNHEVEKPYIETLLKEWDIYLNIFQNKPKLREIHLGGGTPTFFSPENLEYLITNILKKSDLHKDYEFSLEVHPEITNLEHLKTLYKLGFRRLSMGIQDFDPHIQKIINRKQTYEKIHELYYQAREVGFISINFDLIYGLPKQKKENILITMDKVKQFLPDRIALYSYAHVPWKSKTQRKYDESDLPNPIEKRELYETSKNILEEIGYKEIGMDHFSLESDTLYKAQKNKKLHRNFMGYTHNHTHLLVGLGASSISDTWSFFIQNNKDINEYKQAIENNQIPISVGHKLTEEDMRVRRNILNLICNFETNYDKKDVSLDSLQNYFDDGLIEFSENQIIVTDLGKKFIRNICSAFDPSFIKNSKENLFSKAI
ncbi:MAG: oxygen-independent coproporphyrinogen III oxidase [Candidatus Sericytochromatia bacterium]